MKKIRLFSTFFLFLAWIAVGLYADEIIPAWTLENKKEYNSFFSEKDQKAASNVVAKLKKGLSLEDACKGYDRRQVCHMLGEEDNTPAEFAYNRYVTNSRNKFWVYGLSMASALGLGIAGYKVAQYAAQNSAIKIPGYVGAAIGIMPGLVGSIWQAHRNLLLQKDYDFGTNKNNCNAFFPGNSKWNLLLNPELTDDQKKAIEPHSGNSFKPIKVFPEYREVGPYARHSFFKKGLGWRGENGETKKKIKQLSPYGPFINYNRVLRDSLDEKVKWWLHIEERRNPSDDLINIALIDECDEVIIDLEKAPINIDSIQPEKNIIVFCNKNPDRPIKKGHVFVSFVGKDKYSMCLLTKEANEARSQEEKEKE